MRFPSKWIIGLGLALVLGIGFRFVWPRDIEYKADEYYSFTNTQRLLAGHRANPSEHGIARWLGMPTSKGFKNPGMSLWIFAIIGSVSGTGDPTALARGVQVCNVAAILLLLVFAWRNFKEREREWWLWTVAMVCVNPFAVIFERKIWPPCTLPLIMVLFLMNWHSRKKPGSAFFWGLLGVIAGQIHMSGFFYVAAFALWTLLYDRRATAWRWWITGNIVGAIPFLPWLYYMTSYVATSPGQTGSAPFAWWRMFSNPFWLDWITEPFGLGLQYFLGQESFDFLRHPFIGGRPTYGVALLVAIALAIFLLVLTHGILAWWRKRAAWPRDWKDNQASFTGSLLQAGFWFYGILLTISFVRFERHYLLVAFPLAILGVARLALPRDATELQWISGRRVLVTLCITNALMTFMLLDFIHVNGGAPHGDYYRTYGNQLLDGQYPVVPSIYHLNTL